MENKVKVVGEPEIYDILGNRLHLDDKVAIPVSASTLSLGVVIGLGKLRVKVRYTLHDFRNQPHFLEKYIDGKSCIKYDKL